MSYHLLDDSKHHFMLRAPNGAKLKIAKAGLSKDTLSKIQGYAKGGKVEYGASPTNTLDLDATEAFKKSVSGVKTEEQPKPAPQSPPKKVAQFFDGGMATSNEKMMQEEPKATEQESAPSVPEMPQQQQAPVVVNVNGGGSQQPTQGPQDPHQQIQLMEAAYQRGAQTTAQQISQQQEQANQMPQMQHAVDVARDPSGLKAPLNIGQQKPMAQPVSMQDINMAKAQSGLGGLGTLAAGYKAEEEAISNAGQQESKIYESGYGKGSEFRTRLDEIDSNLKGYQTQQQQIIDDLKNSQITPQTMFSNKGTWGKISTALGVLAGGISMGLTGAKTNPVVDFIDREIENDLQAQKADVGRKENLLASLMRQGMNEREAANIVKFKATSLVQGQLEVLAAKTKSPIAKARLLQQIGTLQAKYAPLQQELAQQQYVRAGLKAGKIDPAVAIGQIVPKEERKQADEDLEMVNGYQQAVKDVRAAFDRVRDIGPLSANTPGFTEGTTIDAAKAEIVQTIRSNMKGQGSLSDQEVKDAITPLLFSSFTTKKQLDVKLNSILNILSKKVAGGATRLKRWGIPIQDTTQDASLSYTPVGYKK